MRAKSFLVFVLGVLLFISPWCFGAKSSIKFIPTFSHDNTIVLLGEVPLNTSVTLFQNSPCTVKTSAVRSYYDDALVADIKFTPLQGIESCHFDSSKNTQAIIANPEVKPQLASISTVSDKKEISSLHELAIKTFGQKFSKLSFKDKMFGQAGTGGPVVDESLPGVARVNVKNLTISILNYSFVSGDIGSYDVVPGPKIVVVNQKAYRLTGPCSWRSDPKYFTVNDNVYIATGSGCCDCGIIVEEIYRLTDKGPELVMSDASWSN